MKTLDTPVRRRGLTAMDGVITLIVILLIVQMWLLSATLAAYLAGHTGAVVPAACVSGIIFVGCAALYVLVERIDRNAGR
jgi:FtsH-binding integral membrane protein